MQDETRTEDSSPENDFSLVNGGLLYDLLIRIPLIRIYRYGQLFRILLFIFVTWIPLLVFSLSEGFAFGRTVNFPFLHDVIVNARLLICVPLFLLSEIYIDNRLKMVFKHLSNSGIIPESQKSPWRTALEKLTQQRDSILPELIAFILAYLITWGAVYVYGIIQISRGMDSWILLNDKITLAGYWYLIISLPVYQFLILRWIWRMHLWIQLLWRLSKLTLRLEPMHPDLAGGLAVIWLAQRVFNLVYLAIGVSLSAQLAHQMIFEGISLLDTRSTVIGFLVVCMALLIFPLLFFFKKIMMTKNEGLIKYGALGSQLADQFDDKWIDNKRKEDEAILGSTDPSAVADYSGSFEMIKQMRPLPIDLRELATVALILLIPFIPLPLLKLSISEVLKKLMEILL